MALPCEVIITYPSSLTSLKTSAVLLCSSVIFLIFIDKSIYFVSYIFDFGIIVNIFVHGFINYMGAAKDVFFYFCLVAVKWLFLYFLYKKKIFFKV